MELDAPTSVPPSYSSRPHRGPSSTPARGRGGWFKRFGTVTNVAVDASSSKALVSFSSNEEAHTAWKSEDTVFGNRFVKVFWHRPMEGQGLAGQRALAASAPIVASVTAREPAQTGPMLDAAPTDPSSSAATGPGAKKTPSIPSNLAASELL
jgi:RNA-binding protein 26